MPGLPSSAIPISNDIAIKISFIVDQTGVQTALTAMQKFNKQTYRLQNSGEKLRQNFDKLNPQIYDYTKSQKLGSEITRSFTQQITQGAIKLRKFEAAQIAAEKASKRFNFGFLSTMFYGMMVQRALGNVMKTGVDTFRTITEATYGSSTAMTGLAAASQFLSFSIGEALNTVLEPLMPIILDLVNTFVDFMEQHPEVVWAAIAFYIAAIAATQISQFMLLIQGLRQIDFGAISTGWRTLSAAITGTALSAKNSLPDYTMLNGKLVDIRQTIGPSGGPGLTFWAAGLLAVVGFLAVAFLKWATDKGLQSTLDFIKDMTNASNLGTQALHKLTTAEIARQVVFNKGFNMQTTPATIEQQIAAFNKAINADVLFPKTPEVQPFSTPKGFNQNLSIQTIQINSSITPDQAREIGRQFGIGVGQGTMTNNYVVPSYPI